MKYTAQGESRVANIARGKAKCYNAIFVTRLIKSYIFYTNQVVVFYVFYCILQLLKCQQNTVL